MLTTRIHNFLVLLKRFERDERGIFAVIFGIIAVVLVATAGAVVDFTTVAQARTRAQDALDAAALGLQARIYEDDVTEEDLRVEAQQLLTERLANDELTATVDDAEIDEDTGMLRLTASIGVPTAFVKLVGVNEIDASVVAEARRGALNIEVALALDVTGSMGSATDPDSRISAAKTAAINLVNTVVQDDQTPNYSKLALIPWSNAVNVGSTYAASVRGAATQSTSITGASWLTTGSSYVRTVTAIEKRSPARITTSANHGFTTGQVVNFTNIAGGTSFTNLNGNSYTITRVDSTRFTLDGVNSSSWSGSYTASSGRVTMGSARAIAAVTKANPAVVTTSMAHDLATGDAVYITNLLGGDFVNLNDRWFNVTVSSTTQFSLNSTNTSSYTGTFTANSGVERKCHTTECEVVIISASHGMANNEHVFLTSSPSWLSNVGGHKNIDTSTTDNDYVWEVTDVTTDTYALENSSGPSMGTYSSGSLSWCTRLGCEYYYFHNNASTGWPYYHDYSLHRIRTCVTERISANQYTDVAPATTYVGRQYTASSGDCLSSQIKPLTSNKTTLTTAITALTTSGTTAGQVGTAWAWYMLSPNFASLFPADNQAASYTAPHTKKIAIIMTDGEYNTPYCDGVVAQDHTVGWIIADDESNDCNANNGLPLVQAAAVCTAMKAAPSNIKIYTVGFQLGSDTGVISMLTNCASSAADAYLADNATELNAAFAAIAEDISDLRLAQ
jgi:Flp pilus assembly protein TadG